MVALRLHKYADEIPQIGRVVDLTDLDVTVEWWVGTYRDTWREWKKKGAVVKETMPRNAIIHGRVQLTKSLRLTAATVRELKRAYDAKELI